MITFVYCKAKEQRSGENIKKTDKNKPKETIDAHSAAV